MKLKQKLALNYIRARLNILALVSARSAAASAFEIFCTPHSRPAKKTAPLFEKGEKLSFKLEGHTVRGRRWLPHQASSTTLKKALIVHGFDSSSRNFEQYISGLLKKGYEVLAFDAPAHGESGGRRITLPVYVQTLQAITEQYGPIQSFMGHSLGALALVLMLEAKATGNAILSAAKGQEDNGPVPATGGLAEDTRLVVIAPACEMVAAVDGFFSLLQLSKEIRPAFDEVVVQLSGHPFSWFSMRRALQQVKVPIRWIHDEEDTITPWAIARPIKEEGHPNIEFILTKGLGHRKIYRDSEVMRKVLEFL